MVGPISEAQDNLASNELLAGNSPDQTGSQVDDDQLWIRLHIYNRNSQFDLMATLRSNLPLIRQSSRVEVSICGHGTGESLDDEMCENPGPLMILVKTSVHNPANFRLAVVLIFHTLKSLDEVFPTASNCKASKPIARVGSISELALGVLDGLICLPTDPVRASQEGPEVQPANVKMGMEKTDRIKKKNVNHWASSHFLSRARDKDDHYTTIPDCVPVVTIKSRKKLHMQ